MLNRSSKPPPPPKRPRDLNELAALIVTEATRDEPEPAVEPGIAVPVPVGTEPPADNGKNPAAVMLGRLGGLKGGKARAARLTAEERREIAQRAARVRWHSNSGSKGGE